jgi:IS4 transposase
MHTLINLQGKIPDFILISTGKTHDVQVMDVIEWEAGSWYAMDRGYLDFARLYYIHQCGAFFVTRSKTNTKYERVYSNPVDKSTGILCDQRIRLTGTNAMKDYPEMIRRIRYIDKETGKRLTFLTNNMLVSAETVALLYKNRWHVELFFKWIKQHLRVKRFFGHSENAVKSQIWIAVCVYVLIAIVKARFSLSQSYYEILQILSITVFDKTPIFTLFAGENYTFETCSNHKQLTLFDL